MGRAPHEDVEIALRAPLLEPIPGLLHRAARIPLAAHHGIVRFHDVLAARPERLGCLASAARPIAPSEILFLDIETTGLGREDEVVFLVGAARIDGEFVVLEQWLLAGDRDLRGRAAEREMLERTVALARSKEALVTFVGKAFDRHRLDDRIESVMGERPLTAMAHLDLFHSSKRLFAPSLRDARLSTLESELLGIARGRDLSGAQCPEAWFDFVDSGRRSFIEPVLRHNALDTLTLLALLARTEQVFASPATRSESARAGLLFHAKRTPLAAELALPYLERACAEPIPEGGKESHPAIEALADLLRSRGDSQRALLLLEREGRRRHDCDLMKRAATIAERDLRDAAATLRLLRLAGEYAPADERAALVARLSRLERRIAVDRAAASDPGG